MVTHRSPGKEGGRRAEPQDAADSKRAAGQLDRIPK